MPLFRKNNNTNNNNSGATNNHASSSSLQDDEALARALQEEFAAEFRQTRLQQQQISSIRTSRAAAGAVSAGTAADGTGSSSVIVRGQPVVGWSQRASHPPLPPQQQLHPEDEEYARRLERSLREEEERFNHRSATSSIIYSSHSGLPPPPTARSGDPDEEFARRLQQEIENEVAAAGTVNNSSRLKRTVTPVTSSNSEDEYCNSDDDSVVARRVEQELQDEELARRLSAAEQERLSGYRLTAYQRQLRQQELAATADGDRAMNNTSRRCTFRRVLSYVVPLLLVAGAAAALIWFFASGRQVPDFFPSPDDFRNEDPFYSKNASQVEKWRTNGFEGLTLEVVAALDTIWIPFFDQAISDWDNGTPDALTLTKSYMDHDYACDPINFKLKVCNGDYGDTKWRGINKILISDNYIFASTAKMNEYYFTGSSNTDAQRQYTMCHEIGHGFGLPHSDENFNNPDLGTCMDYTNNPEVNKQPNESNFNFLEQLYGTVPGNQMNPTDGSAATQNAENVAAGGGRRRRLHQNQKLRAAAAAGAIPDWVVEKWHALDREGEGESSGWRILHQSEFGEAHEVDIGGGYVIQVFKIFQ